VVVPLYAQAEDIVRTIAVVTFLHWSASPSERRELARALPQG
jgi:hypothetical protein